MQLYVSLLRGINVSGKNPIKMSALRDSYAKLGFTNIETYLQSGNVIFSAQDISESDLELLIHKQIQLDFAFDIPILVLRLDKLKRIIANNPLAQDESKDSSFLHVTFLASKPEQYDKAKIERKKAEGEEIAFAEDAVYLYCPQGYGRTKLTNTYIESATKIKATTRNWATTQAVCSHALRIAKA
mgnify:CR=1 FL=1